MESLFKMFGNALGNGTTGPKPGGIVGTLLTAIIGGVAGLFLSGGNPIGLIVGAVAGFMGGTYFGDTFNNIAKSFGFGPKPFGRRENEVPADEGLIKEHAISITQPGKKPAVEATLATADMEILRKSAAEVKSPEEIATERAKAKLPKISPEQKQVAEASVDRMERDMSRFASNVHAWNAKAQKFNAEDQPRLEEALNTARAATGKEPLAVPLAPTFDLKLPELTPELQQYAVDMFSKAKGSKQSDEDFRKAYATPMERLTFVAAQLNSVAAPDLDHGFWKEHTSRSWYNIMAIDGAFNQKIIDTAAAVKDKNHRATIRQAEEGLRLAETNKTYWVGASLNLTSDEQTQAKVNLEHIIEYSMAQERLKEVQRLDNLSYKKLHEAKGSVVKAIGEYEENVKTLRTEISFTNTALGNQNALAPQGIDQGAVKAAVNGMAPVKLEDAKHEDVQVGNTPPRPVQKKTPGIKQSEQQQPLG
jgi:hypothetical protein